MSAAPRLIIAGGGLSGCLAALALAERRPELPFLLIEQEQSFGGNHVWSFFDSDIKDEDRWLIDPIVSARWPAHDIHFPRRSRTIEIAYNSIKSENLDRIVRHRLNPKSYRLGGKISAVAADHVVLDDGERIDGTAVIDARGGGKASSLDLAWQKFVGTTYRFDAPHGCTRPIIMDARVDQQDGYRFVYTLPFSETELMVEDTYYSSSPLLDLPLIGGRVDSHVRQAGWGDARALNMESGVLPVLLGGELADLWPVSGPPIARLGLGGGFFHPTTGYSLPDAAANAALLARQEHFSAAALHQLYRSRASHLWKERSFYQLLNRMLFRAATPNKRYRVLEHFYRLPEPVIGRFYSGQLTTIDKLRILSGRPPVPIGRALAAMRERSA